MNKYFLSFFFSFGFGVVSSFAQTTSIPDPNFENYLETHSADGSVVNLGDASSLGDGIAGNGLVLTARINSVASLDVNGLNISNLTGIAAFSALETLICSNNNLISLDVSGNTALKALLCGSNLLTSLSVSTNSALETLNCSNNQLSVLNLANNNQLKSLSCSGNKLAQIDVSDLSNLTFLSVSSNQLSGPLNVSNNPNLESLFVASNNITSLDLSNNTALKTLNAANNSLTSLDLTTINTKVCPDPQTNPVTSCQGAASINVSQNQLVSLVVSNGFNSLISNFNAEDNPDLFCIQTDVGFTPPSDWIKDAWTYFSEATCADIYTYVPDDNFEQALIDLGYDTVLDNFVLTSNINGITSLDVASKAIASFEGIEDFLGLQILNCSLNSLTALDLSANTSMLQLDCSNNSLETVNISSNAVLNTFDCSNNNLSSLDVASNSSLSILNCSNNLLSQLWVANNTSLANLDCSFNQLESLEVTNNTSLITLNCSNNSLNTLNLQNSNNNILSQVNATSNSALFCILVDNVGNANVAAGWQKDVAASYSLNCGTYVPDDNFEQALIDLGIDTDNTLNNYVDTVNVSAVTNLDVSGLDIVDFTGLEDFVALQNFNGSNNSAVNLDLSANLQLTMVDCSFNQIGNLDLSLNTALTSLLCNDNALFSLNIQNGNNGALTTLNATNNANLFCITVDNGILANIPVGWQKDAFTNYNSDCENNRFTAVPDDNFEQALIDLGLDSGPLDDQVLTSNVEHILSLNVNDRQISDLTGIQDFKSLQTLDCSANYLNELDVSNLFNLQELNCASNYLVSNDISNPIGLLNLTGTASLKKLFCAGNNLQSLDMTAQVNLETLDCADNNLSILDIANNAQLVSLNCANNTLTTLDISNNNALVEVNCDNNNISNLVSYSVDNTTLENLSCSSNTISNLNVNRFLALKNLYCRSNSLSQLTVSANAALEVLDFSRNSVASINLANNLNLKTLLASQNSLGQIDLSSNTLLQRLQCDNNQLTQLVVSNNTSLIYLTASSNQIGNLDLSNCPNLIEINVASNQLLELLLSNNLGSLKTFNCSNNLLSADLDLSTMGTAACPNNDAYCPASITINVSVNQFDFVTIQNGVNNNITNFNASNNPNLTCIQVDNPNQIGANWFKDAKATYSTDCRFGETYVPDDNFEQALIDLGLDVAPLDDYVLTNNINVLQILDVRGYGISDLTGIEDFIQLQNLNVSNNALAIMDLSSNLNLQILDASNNVLTQLDISNNSALTNLNIANNQLSDLDISNNTDLTNLDISSNNFSAFETTVLTALEVFNCDFNQIIALDFQSNANLTNLSCQNNILENLNLKNGQNSNLANFNAQNNANLLCIETDSGSAPNGVNWLIDASASYSVDCRYGQTFVPDDNFEQALINLGYDSEPLDDYVATANIETVTFLDVSNQNIADFTGITDFLSLTNLNFEGNNIINVDLSQNTLLLYLNAANNDLNTVDISTNSLLITANISGNNLVQIDLSSNINLVNLDVSKNNLNALNVDALASLETLNCAENNISQLSVVSNPNLMSLYCQSNAFVGDQLNLQNGTNQNLTLFNATNNPLLSCILVDDPFTVITNANGKYDGWFKDASANYQTICEDADNDGVANVDDQCPNTPFGDTVDLFGCSVLSLPNDNFTVQITGETCLNNNDGKISITTKNYYNYTATLTTDGFSRDYHFTNDIDILNLLAGTYRMCITIEEWPNYESCYDIVISQPEPLQVLSGKSGDGKKVSLNLSGSSSYNINFNGLNFTTSEKELNLSLQKGVNTIKISTDLDCQGIFEQQILLSDDVWVYPNPTKTNVTVYLGDLIKSEINLSLFNYQGKQVLHRKLKDYNSDIINIDMTFFEAGIYLLRVQDNTEVTTLKIIKK